MTFLAIAIGAFYIFAGVVALRAMRLDRLMDDALVALQGKPTASNERWKSTILTAGAYLTLASGLALATLSAFALPLFIANVAVQGAYLVWAARALPPSDAGESKGRRQTTNAFVIYTAVCAFVGWLACTNGLRALPANTSSMLIELLPIAIGIFAGWASLYLSGSTFVSSPSRLHKTTNLRLSPNWQRCPLWDDDTGTNVSHYQIDLPDDLVERIEAWDDTWQVTYNGDDPASCGFKSDADLRAYRETGKQIAQDLAKIWPGKLKVPDEFL